MTVKRKKISQRLQQLDDMITKPYRHIWDCCCDHGFLGLTLLKREAAGTIHFVDCVPDIMSELTAVLERFFTISDTEKQAKNTSWQVHCLDVGQLVIPDDLVKVSAKPSENIEPNPMSSHLIIIAGVGGEQTAELVTKIINNHPNQQLEFLLCPVHYHYHLRERLQQLNCTLIDEKLLCENKRFYEFIHVVTDGGQVRYLPSKIESNSENSNISSVGSSMWDFSLATHRSYLEKTLKHYQRMAINNQGNVNGINVNVIIDAYQALSNKV